MTTESTHTLPRNQIRMVLYLMLALALVRGVMYAVIVPPWQAPDEPAQFERVRASLTAKEWAATSQNAPAWYDALRDSLFEYAFFDYISIGIDETPNQPLNRYIDLYQEVYDGLYGNRLSFAVMGWPLFLARNENITLQLYLARINGVLLYVGVIWLAYLMTRAVFPNDIFLILGVPAALLFNPQHTHNMTTINNGNLAEFLATAAIFFMVLGAMRGFSPVNVAAMLALSLAAMWTKATAYFLFASLAAVGLIILWGYRRYWRWLLPIGGLLGVIAFVFAPARLNVLIEMGWNHLTHGGLTLHPSVLPSIFRSFWAQPGWANLRLAPIWYQLLGVGCGVALIGLILLLARKRHTLSTTQWQSLLILAVSVAVSMAIPIGWHIISGTLAYRHGRSLYPVIVPIYILLFVGWSQFVPQSWRKIGLLGLTAVFVLFDTLVLFDYIFPFFYSRY